MKFLADENIELQIKERLCKDGHVVWYVGDISPSIPDDEVLELANNKKAILLTGDKDFGELVYRQGRVTEGVILIRLFGLPAEEKADIVSVAINQHKNSFCGAFSVITSKNIRIRRREV